MTPISNRNTQSKKTTDQKSISEDHCDEARDDAKFGCALGEAKKGREHVHAGRIIVDESGF